MSSVELQARDKGVSVVSELNGAGDAMCSPRVVRVLQNLLVNAVRHTPTDGTIRVEAELTPGLVLIAVEDTGEGIAPEDVRGSSTRSSARIRRGAGRGPALVSRSRSGSSKRWVGASPPGPARAPALGSRSSCRPDQVCSTTRGGRIEPLSAVVLRGVPGENPLVAPTGQHLVKEPTELRGTRRNS